MSLTNVSSSLSSKTTLGPTDIPYSRTREYGAQAPRRGLWGFDGREGVDREFDEFEISMNSEVR